MFLVQVTEQHQSHFPNLDQKILLVLCFLYSVHLILKQINKLMLVLLPGVALIAQTTQVAKDNSLSIDCNHRLKSSSQ